MARSTDLLARLTEAAEALGDQPALDMARAVQELGRAPKTQLLIAGTTGSGRFSVAGAILGRPDLLPRSPLPRIPVSTLLRSGAVESVETVAIEGARSALPLAKLRSVLVDPAGIDRYTAVEIEAPSPLLTVCDIRIEPLEANRPPDDWRRLLAGSDFTVLILNAGALLSQEERDFVRDYLANGYGLHRVAIVVNKIDLIPDDEREGVLELLRTFLGPFERQPAVIPLVATDAIRQLEAGKEASSGLEALRTLMADLTEGHATHRASGMRQAISGLIAALEEGLARQEALLSLDREEIEGVRRVIAERRGWLQERIERAQRRIEAFVGALIRDQVMRDIESFGEVFRNRLPSEVESVYDLSTIKRYFPGYIESVWLDFLDREMLVARGRLVAEMGSVTRMVETDLADLFGGHQPLWRALREFDLTPDLLHSFVVPRRGKHKAAGTARALNYHGFIALLMGSPAGLVSIAAGQVVRAVNRPGIESADRQALVASAAEAGRDLEREVRERVDTQFTELTDRLKKAVAALYLRGIGGIEEVLDDAQGRGADIAGRRAELEALADRIKKMKAEVHDLDPAEVT